MPSSIADGSSADPAHATPLLPRIEQLRQNLDNLRIMDIALLLLRDNGLPLPRSPLELLSLHRNLLFFYLPLLFLLDREISAFRAGCDVPVDEQSMLPDLSSPRVIMSGSEQLHRAFKEGYNLTLISGMEKHLLYGLSGLYVSPCQPPRMRHWSAILIATKDGQ